MKALSIRQPWAWLIIHGGKDVENRTWPTKFRGRVLIHAGKTPVDFGDFALVMNWLYIFLDHGNIARRMPSRSAYELGGIVGSVEVVDCVRQSDSPWFEGPFGFVLRDPKPMQFQPCPGALGFFEVPEEILS